LGGGYVALQVMFRGFEGGSFTTKLSSGDENPPIANVLLAVVPNPIVLEKQFIPMKRFCLDVCLLNLSISVNHFHSNLKVLKTVFYN